MQIPKWKWMRNRRVQIMLNVQTLLLFVPLENTGALYPKSCLHRFLRLVYLHSLLYNQSIIVKWKPKIVLSWNHERLFVCVFVLKIIVEGLFFQDLSGSILAPHPWAIWDIQGQRLYRGQTQTYMLLKLKPKQFKEFRKYIVWATYNVDVSIMSY